MLILTQYFAHHFPGCAPDLVFAEVVERFQICLVKSVSDDFDVHLIQILFANAVNEKRCQRCVHQYCIVEISRVGRHVNGLHLVKRSQWMTLRDQFRKRPLM